MKIYIYILLLLSSTLLNAKDNNQTHIVNEQYEFTSIVWRLAGAEEYNQCNIKAYADAIDVYFAPYKNDTLINYCKQIRRQNGVSFDAIAKSTSFLVLNNDSISIVDGFNVDSISIIENR